VKISATLEKTKESERKESGNGQLQMEEKYLVN
jgi:hypothetical protein